MRVRNPNGSSCRRGRPWRAFPSALADYPDRPVTIIVPFPPGGANDIVVRILSEPLSKALGQPVVVDNRGGAGGNIGIAAAARAQPDGYTILIAASGFAANPSLYAKVAYDPFRDFVPIADLVFFPCVLAVRPDIGINALSDLIAFAKEHPGKLNYASPGIGTVPHLAADPHQSMMPKLARAFEDLDRDDHGFDGIDGEADLVARIEPVEQRRRRHRIAHLHRPHEALDLFVVDDQPAGARHRRDDDADARVALRGALGAGRLGDPLAALADDDAARSCPPGRAPARGSAEQRHVLVGRRRTAPTGCLARRC